MNNVRTTLRLGTRGSLLAVAQSRLIADALRRERPDSRVHIVPVETRGDRNKDIPLSRVRDPNFFSAELDAALLRNDVDFCVHSIKDLGDNRPIGIFRAAVPARENPRDVIVFRADVMDRLERGKPIRIGSSSQRRRANVEPFLRDALPHTGVRPRLRFLPLRGAVDARLRRIHVGPDHADALDGVVLAIAGLARLWNDADGRSVVAPLLTNVRWMVLPPSTCPAAPGQGALALECRRDDLYTRELLATAHDDHAATIVQHELDILARVPESQRTGVGVTALDTTALEKDALGPITFVRGANQDEIIWNAPPSPHDKRAWDGQELGRTTKHRALPMQFVPHCSGAVFVAHWRAITTSVSINDSSRIWVSGITSWRQLARRGLWVEGCADNLGFASIVPTLMCPVLRLPPLADWTTLTHSRADAGWKTSGIGRVIPTYAHEPSDNPPTNSHLESEIRAAKHFFWGNIGQFNAVRQWLPADAEHACGAGKTARALRESGVVAPRVFPSRRAWQTWLR